MKIKQYCSVCREELEMEVVPTEEEEEDGVIWLRCPGCRGFLPRISGSLAEEIAARETATGEAPPTDHEPARDRAAQVGAAGAGDGAAGISTAPSPADATGRGDADGAADAATDRTEPEPPSGSEAAASDPLAEYARRLAEIDPEAARPYRPWEAYEEGDVLHHLAWDDLGLVVGKEMLPGGRSVLKVYFDHAGVVRLIEKAEVEP